MLSSNLSLSILQWCSLNSSLLPICCHTPGVWYECAMICIIWTIKGFFSSPSIKIWISSLCKLSHNLNYRLRDKKSFVITSHFHQNKIAHAYVNTGMNMVTFVIIIASIGCQSCHHFYCVKRSELFRTWSQFAFTHSVQHNKDRSFWPSC